MLREREEEVLALPRDRRRAADRAARGDQLLGPVRLPAHLAGVAVLVRALAVGAGPADEPVRQEAPVDLAVRLPDRPAEDVPGLLESPVDQLGVVLVLRAVGGVEGVERDAEVPQVRPVRLPHPGHHRLGRQALLRRVELDGRAVRVVRADEHHLVPGRALEADEDVRQDVLHHVTEVERTIGVRQRGGDEELLLRGHRGVASEGAARGRGTLAARAHACTVRSRSPGAEKDPDDAVTARRPALPADHHDHRASCPASSPASGRWPAPAWPSSAGAAPARAAGTSSGRPGASGRGGR